jgi:S1-C subfamily serine protease
MINIMKNTYFKQFTFFLALFFIGISAFIFFEYRQNNVFADKFSFDEQEATVRAIKKNQASVVDVLIYEENESLNINVKTGEKKIEKNKELIGSGTGFIISANGLILTNKHVVTASKSVSVDYKVVLNSGKKYSAKVLSKDPLNDLAVLKIEDKKLPAVELGDSSKLQIGSTVIAIGNALGRYQNSATKGIVSGLGRHIIANDQEGNSEAIDNVIQTDAEINPGNSGGPLVDLEGRVVGINVAIDQSGSAIGFAIPINDIKSSISSVKENGKIIKPRMGVRYVMLNAEIAAEKNLSRSNGALLLADSGEVTAVLSGSPAAKAGLDDGDIIFKINGIELNEKNTLLSVVQRFKPGDKIGVDLQRGQQILHKTVELDEFK